MNKTKRKRVNKEAIWAYVFILLPLCTFTVFTIYPVVSSIVTSFQDYKPLGSEWVGFGNYVSTFKNNLFYKALKNTAVYTVITVPIAILMSFIISIMILPFRKKIQSVFKGAFYLPAIASGVALSFVWKWIYDPLPSGLLNSLFRFFGFSNQNWLGNSKTAMASLIIMAVFAGLGQNIIIYIAALIRLIMKRQILTGRLFCRRCVLSCGRWLNQLQFFWQSPVLLMASSRSRLLI